MLNNNQIQMLKDFVKKEIPDSYDTFDTHAEIDRSLNYFENKNILREKIMMFKDPIDIGLEEFSLETYKEKEIIYTEEYTEDVIRHNTERKPEPYIQHNYITYGQVLYYNLKARESLDLNQIGISKNKLIKNKCKSFLCRKNNRNINRIKRINRYHKSHSFNLNKALNLCGDIQQEIPIGRT